MTSRSEPSPRTSIDSSSDTLPPSWQRLLALSGVVFAVLFVVGWFASGGDAPDYAAGDQEWTEWADENEWRSRIGAFAMLLAGFVFLHFVGTIRSVLGTAETAVRGSAQLARVAFAGALIGITGMTTAIVMIAAASSEGADADPVVSRAVTTASAGPFLVAATGFAALLATAMRAESIQRVEVERGRAPLLEIGRGDVGTFHQRRLVEGQVMVEELAEVGEA